MLPRLICVTCALVTWTASAFALETVSAYHRTDLVANRAGVSVNTAVTLDAALVNPWGIAFGFGPAWTANNDAPATSLITGTGTVITNFATPDNPTGIVANPNGRLFAIPVASGSTTTTPASFIFAHETGGLSAWSGGLTDTASAVSVVPVSAAASYKGLALGANGSGTFLYAANFKGGKVDIYDSRFQPASVACSFVDPLLPAGYAPFGIQNVAGDIVVAYALQADSSGDEAHGAGLGRVDVYTADGCLVRRLHDRGALNAPWGIALAPRSFGRHGSELLVGNFGSGTIAAFDFHSGEFSGYLRDGSGAPIAIDGLWGIAFGNGASAQPASTLFFAAGANDEADGIYGRIDAVTVTAH